jgi:two-component system, cell cycle response regulator
MTARILIVDDAARAKEILRESGLLCRVGGDEFVIVMPGTDLGGGFKIAEKIRAAVAGIGFAVGEDGRPIPVTVSAGLAESKGDSCASLLRRVGIALYRAKQAGRNRISVARAPH